MSTDFIAKLEYISTENGGRKSHMKSGYRPQIKFDFTEDQTSGKQIFIDKDIVLPGEVVVAEIILLSPYLYYDQLEVGMKYEIKEGAKIVGYGEIIKILNNKLEKMNELERQIKETEDTASYTQFDVLFSEYSDKIEDGKI